MKHEKYKLHQSTTKSVWLLTEVSLRMHINADKRNYQSQTITKGTSALLFILRWPIDYHFDKI